MDAAADPVTQVLDFGRHLRANGFAVGIPEQHSLLRMLMACTPAGHRQVRIGWRAAVCRDARQWQRYDELFDAYWYPGRLRVAVRSASRPGAGHDLRQMVDELHRRAEQTPSAAAEGGAPDGEPAHPVARGGASATEALAARPMAGWSGTDQAVFEDIARRLARRLRQRLLRRHRPDPRAGRLDVRATLRASLATGGLPLAPVWCRRQRRVRPPWVLVDVSRSMESLAALHLRLARVLVEVLDARVFVFHTRLAEVTALLRRAGPTAGERLRAATGGFGSGTCIASGLRQLLDTCRDLSGHRARVLLFSDGFDTDPPEALAGQLGRLKDRGARLVWLHPGEQPPRSQAVAHCAGLVDRFARGDSVASLSRLDAVID